MNPSLRHALRMAAILCLFGSPAVVGTAAESRVVIAIQRQLTLAGHAVESIAVDPFSPSTIYAVTAGTGPYVEVLKSTDGGASWTLTGAPVGSLPLDSIQVSTDPNAPGTVYAALGHCFYRFPMFCGGGVYRSGDGGASWSAIRSGMVSDIVEDSLSAGTLYAIETLVVPDPVFPGHGSFVVSAIKSLDSGSTWEDLSLPGSFPSALAVDPVHEGRLLAGTAQGVFQSDDGGATWMDFNDGLTDRFVEAVAIAEDGATAYAGTDGGVFRRSDGGAWVATDLTAAAVAFAVDPRDPRIVYAAAQGGIFGSSDAGATWSRIPGPAPIAGALALDPAGEILYVGTAEGLLEIPIRKTRLLPPRAPISVHSAHPLR